jgi:hypothetical protein
MLIFLALLYFCLACSLIWLACFPSGRASILLLLGGLQRRLQLRAGAWREPRAASTLRNAGSGAALALARRGPRYAALDKKASRLSSQSGCRWC